MEAAGAWASRSLLGDEKRTVLEARRSMGGGVVVDGATGFDDWAWAKSPAREGSLGWVSVEVVAGEA